MFAARARLGCDKQVRPRIRGEQTTSTSMACIDENNTIARLRRAGLEVHVLSFIVMVIEPSEDRYRFLLLI